VTVAPESGKKRKSELASFAGDRHFVTALARGLEVLACFRSGRKTLGNQELAERCGLPKSTVSRLTHTLVRLGYLTHDEDSGKYTLGMATLSLGVGMLAKLDIRQVARPYMQELADFSHAMVSLGVRDRLSMLYIENCRSQSAIAGEAERREIADRLSELDAWSHREIMDGIDRAVSEYRELGVTTSFGDWQKDVNAIALGFQFSSTQPIMVLTCGAPSFKVSEDFLLNEVRPRLQDVVEKIKLAMGHQ
jgi:DNA-binding IclR family transcriptional regulator